MKRKIVNIVNFMRGVEPRPGITYDIHEVIHNEIALMEQYNLRGTFLLEYDALIDPMYQETLKKLPADRYEIGLWHEIVQPHAEEIGVKWEGRYPWDWFSNFCYTGAYTFAQREQLVDVAFEKFKEVFGYYPKVVGSWIWDAHTLEYMTDKYAISAFCNCKDQYGTDGYTLLGGYYNQGYYPCRNNSLCPATTAENQINVPMFRMLGSDPIYQYDWGLDPETGPKAIQTVVSLEPVYKRAGGGVPSWVDWYMKENFSDNCLAFAYTQTGQENSFGWPAMKDGLEYQFPLLRRLVDEGKVELQLLSETGEYFKETFPQTPATSIVCETDWNADCKTVWYNCKNYRLNLLTEGERFWIRDTYLFDETYCERYMTTLCTTKDMTLDNLPVMDGNLYSGGGVRAGIYPYTADGTPATFAEMKYSEPDTATARVDFLDKNGGIVCTIICGEDRVELIGDLVWRYEHNPSAQLPLTAVEAHRATFTHQDFEYAVAVEGGVFDGKTIRPDNGRAVLRRG